MSELWPYSDLNSQTAHGSYIAQANHGGTAIINVFQAATAQVADPTEVATAEDLLTTLPLDTLPDVRGLQAPYFMPWRRNQSFVGREPELRMLARQLREGGTAAVGQSPAITGIGGGGKSQLAVEFAYRYGRWFKGGVFWVDCAHRANIPEAIAACGPALHFLDAGFSARPLPDRVQLVSSTWASELPRLLIFDNCEDEAILDDWVPKGGGCRLLITAQRVSWSLARGIVTVPLGVLARPQSQSFLHRHRSDLNRDDPGLNAIAEELGDLPLALELAGSYLARYRGETIGTPISYLAELRASDVLAHGSLTTDDPELFKHSKSITGHKMDVARTFEVSLRRMQSQDPVDTFAHKILTHASWLASGVPIPRDLLKLCVGVDQNNAVESRMFVDGLNRLLDLALLEGVDGSHGPVFLHRLIAIFTRTRVEAIAAVQHDVENAMAVEANALIKQSNVERLQGWAPHLQAAFTAAWQNKSGAVVSLLNSMSAYNTFVGNYRTSYDMLQEGVKYVETNLGPCSNELVSLLGNLAIVQYEIGEFSNAESNHRRALAIISNADGQNHLEAARTLTNIGNTQYALGKWAAAEDTLRFALKLKESTSHPDLREIGITLGNLAAVQLERGRLVIAGKTIRRALAAKTQAFGPDSIEVAMTKVNLGVLYTIKKHYKLAESSFTEALEAYERLLPPFHPNTAGILGNRGKVRCMMGRNSEAIKDCSLCYEIFRAKLGDEHPRTMLARNALEILRSSSGVENTAQSTNS